LLTSSRQAQTEAFCSGATSAFSGSAGRALACFPEPMPSPGLQNLRCSGAREREPPGLQTLRSSGAREGWTAGTTNIALLWSPGGLDRRDYKHCAPLELEPHRCAPLLVL